MFFALFFFSFFFLEFINTRDSAEMSITKMTKAMSEEVTV